MQAKSDIILENYPSRQVLDLIADKWRPIVLYILGQGTKRYSDLQRQLPGVSKKMLTQTLRRLEQDGLLTRKAFPVVPPRVEYDLTRLGQTFLEPVAALCAWANNHKAELNTVRKNRAKHKCTGEKSGSDA
jgi:DNA-binding HxlR family transcriptional regulator